MPNIKLRICSRIPSSSKMPSSKLPIEFQYNSTLFIQKNS
jgi:hypothetical protein